jgi:hypothetical protein
MSVTYNVSLSLVSGVGFLTGLGIGFLVIRICQNVLCC